MKFFLFSYTYNKFYFLEQCSEILYLAVATLENHNFLIKCALKGWITTMDPFDCKVIK